MNHKITNLVTSFFGDSLSLEDILKDLDTYGNTRLSKIETGWYCVLVIIIKSTKAEIEIKSKFKHTTPREAALDCLKQSVKTIDELKEI